MANYNALGCVRLLTQGLIALGLLAALTPLQGAVVSSVQRGSLTSSGNGTVTAPLATVDPSKSFLVFQTRHDSNRPVGSMVRGRIASPTSVEFVRVTDQSASAITFDAGSNANASYQAALSWSHSIGGGSDRKLVVGVAVEEETPGDEVVTGITYGGAPLTFARSASITDVGGANAGYTQRVELWYLDEASLPGAGTYTVQVNLTGVSREINAGAISLNGVRAGPPEATGTNTLYNSPSISSAITTATDRAWLIDVVGSGDPGNFSAGSGQSERWDTSASSATGAMSTRSVASAGAVAMQQDFNSTANRMAHAVIAVAPASTVNIDVDIHWQVVEFSAGVNVQRGEATQTSATMDVTLPSAVSGVNQAFVTWSKTPAIGDVVWSADDPLTGQLTSPTNLRLRANAANPAHVIWWQVIEFTDPADIAVQTGSAALTGSTLSVDVVLPTPVVTSRTFVLVGFRGPGTGADVGKRMLRARLISANTVRIDRAVATDNNDNIDEIIWQVVELKDGSTVQHASENLAAGVAQSTVSISAVDTNRAIAFAGTQPAGGQNMGRSDYLGDDVIGVGSVTLDLSASQILLERSSTVAQSDIGWFVVEFNSTPTITNNRYLLSTGGNATLGGLTFQRDDLVDYDPVPDTATLFFDGANEFSNNEDIDAVHVLDNGHILLSTTGGATLGGVTFEDEDLVEYDPVSDTATLLFDGSTVFSGNEDIDAVHILDNGHIVLSTTGDATIAGLDFEDEDLVEYDPVSGTATIVFSRNLFSGNEDIDAVHVIEVPTNTLSQFDIDHDGFGIHCLGESISVTPEQSDGSPLLGYAGTIVLDTQTGSGSWIATSGNGVLVDATPDDGIATYAFSGSEGFPVGFTLYYPSGPAGFNIDVYENGSPTLRDDDTEGDMAFSPNGFTVTPAPLGNPPGAITPIPNQVAGTPFTLYLTAYGQTPADPECGVIETYEPDKDLKFWSNYDNPASGTIQVTVAGTPIATSEAGAGVQTITFTQGQASVIAKYKDVGRIQISMKDDTVADPDLPNGIRGGTNLFVVKPYDFVLSNIQRTSDGFPNQAAPDASGLVFMQAGDDFSVTVTVLDSEGSTTPNYGQENPPAESVLLAPSLVAAGFSNNPAVQFTTGFVFNNGIGMGDDFSWGEVGVITLTPSVGDGNYLGAGDVTGTTTGNVGRFIPFDFDVTYNTPEFGTACGTFGYLGQSFSYVTAPVLTVSARNKAATITQNYSDTFWKLSNTSLSFPAGTDKGYAAASGALDTALIGSPLPAIVDLGQDTGSNHGTGTLTFNSGGGLAFSRVGPVIPFDAEISLSLNVIDDDTVAYAGNPAQFGDASAGNGISFSNGNQQRYGRARVVNAHGSELLDLAVPLSVQYFDSASTFVDNADDTCTNVTVTLVDVTPLDGLDAATETCIWDSGSPGASGSGCPAGAPAGKQFAEPPVAGLMNLFLKAPGATNYGSADLTVDAPWWLEYNWAGAGDTDPTARATFGVYGGSPHIIFVREPWN